MKRPLLCFTLLLAACGSTASDAPPTSQPVDNSITPSGPTMNSTVTSSSSELETDAKPYPDAESAFDYAALQPPEPIVDRTPKAVGDTSIGALDAAQLEALASKVVAPLDAREAVTALDMPAMPYPAAPGAIAVDWRAEAVPQGDIALRHDRIEYISHASDLGTEVGAWLTATGITTDHYRVMSTSPAAAFQVKGDPECVTIDASVNDAGVVAGVPSSWSIGICRYRSDGLENLTSISVERVIVANVSELVLTPPFLADARARALSTFTDAPEPHVVGWSVERTIEHTDQPANDEWTITLELSGDAATIAKNIALDEPASEIHEGRWEVFVGTDAWTVSDGDNGGVTVEFDGFRPVR